MNGRLRTILAGAALAAAILAVAPASGAQPRETSGSGGGKKAEIGRDVSVTVYNDNLGVVKDRRTFPIEKGVADLSFTDVAATIDPTSVHLRSLGGAPLDILWQDYRYDLVSTDKLMERYLDQPIDVATKDDQVHRGTLLSYDHAALVLRESGGGLALLSRAEVRRVGLEELPKGLITRPTLVWRLRSASGGAHPLEVSYMAGGLSWHAEYVAVLDASETSLDLQGWASVENRSGATFDDARIKLVAGAIHRAPQPRPVFKGDMGLRAAIASEAMDERAFFEYHLYEVPLRATLANNEVKQVGMLHASGVKAAKRYTYDAARDNDNVLVTVEFENAAGAGLGMPLPEGVVRVFHRDTDGSLELAGEDRIKHTPKNETVRVSVGNAFDVGVERKQTEYKKITPRLTETSFEITLRNHKKEAIDVIVVEHAGGDWEIVTSSIPAKKKDATTIEFSARCAPEKPVVVAYTIRTKS